MVDKKGDYQVGYGRPPTQSRFKPGQSGNPRGRTKGMLNLKTDLGEELAERIRVREGQRELLMSKQRAMLKALVAKALKGDTRAMGLLLTLISKHLESEIPAAGEDILSQTDRDILDDFLTRNSLALSKTTSMKKE
jgi:hypothetical protein